MLRGVPQIEVTFEINTNGILEVSAVETSTGVENKIVIKNDRNNVLSEEDIKRMVEEAEKFKEQDRIMREIADARNVLNDYAYVVVRVFVKISPTDSHINSCKNIQVQNGSHCPR